MRIESVYDDIESIYDDKPVVMRNVDALSHDFWTLLLRPTSW